MVYIRVPLHARMPGDCSLILQVGPRRKRIFTCPNTKEKAGEGVDPIICEDVLMKLVTSKIVYGEHIGTVEHIIRGFKRGKDMSSGQWAAAVVGLCEKEGCFVDPSAEED